VYISGQLRRILPLIVLYIHSLPIDKLRSFNISFFLGVIIIISDLNNTVKERPLPPDDG